MQKIEILRLDSLSRAPMIVEGYRFEGRNPQAPSVAIVGAMQGDAILPLHSASKLVDFLRNKLASKNILGTILVIPSVNHYALNINERFWPLDKTDINMMFPGYAHGETTQRIAAKLFEALRGFDYGVVLETRSDVATCLPYVKLYKTGMEDLHSARAFGHRLIHHREPLSIETVSLQYNWQLWKTKACSVICPNDRSVNLVSAGKIFQGLVSYLNNLGMIEYETFNRYDSVVLSRERIEIIQSPNSGIFIVQKSPGAMLAKGDLIGEIVHALEGNVVHRFFAPCDGMLTCYYNQALIFENAVACRIARIN